LIERRRFKRVEAKLPIRCRIYHRDKGINVSNEITTSTKNISQGGVLLDWPRGWECEECVHCLGWIYNLNCRLKDRPEKKMTRSLDPGIFLSVELEPPTPAKPTKTLAKVVWVKGPRTHREDTYNVGVAFNQPLKSKKSLKKAK